MDILIFVTVVIFSLAAPAAMIAGATVFLWRAVNCFAKGTFAQKAARVAAAVTTITCIGFVLVETYSVYEPWLMAKQGERTSGIIILFGPLLFGIYSTVFSLSVGAILFGAAKLSKLVKRTEP